MQLNNNKDAGYVNFLKTQSLLDYLKGLNIENIAELYPMIYNICVALQPDDIDNFAKFINKIYESGYYKSVEDHKKALEAHGLSAVFKS
jgi:hypothetical protein